nr:hypothetical protein BaRGS_031158 [Batillaria attramentaria]
MLKNIRLPADTNFKENWSAAAWDETRLGHRHLILDLSRHRIAHTVGVRALLAPQRHWRAEAMAQWVCGRSWHHNGTGELRRWLSGCAGALGTTTALES